MKIFRDFKARPILEQEFLMSDSWCDSCGQADLGMREPVEYEENGESFVEGKCLKCGAMVSTKVLTLQSKT